MSLDWTQITAIIGASTGTIALAWNFIQGYLNRSRLVVRTEVVSEFTLNEGKQALKQSLINVKVTNVGKHPITVSKVSITHGDTKWTWRKIFGIPEKADGVFSWHERGYPKELNEGQYFMDTAEVNYHSKDFGYTTATTSLGKTYCCSKADADMVKKRIQRLIDDGWLDKD